jgi:hypothetical protein
MFQAVFSGTIMGLSLYKVWGMVQEQGGFRRFLQGIYFKITRLILYESKHYIIIRDHR